MAAPETRALALQALNVRQFPNRRQHPHENFDKLFSTHDLLLAVGLEYVQPSVDTVLTRPLTHNQPTPAIRDHPFTPQPLRSSTD